MTNKGTKIRKERVRVAYEKYSWKQGMSSHTLSLHDSNNNLKTYKMCDNRKTDTFFLKKFYV